MVKNTITHITTSSQTYVLVNLYYLVRNCDMNLHALIVCFLIHFFWLDDNELLSLKIYYNLIKTFSEEDLILKSPGLVIRMNPLHFIEDNRLLSNCLTLCDNVLWCIWKCDACSVLDSRDGVVTNACALMRIIYSHVCWTTYLKCWNWRIRKYYPTICFYSIPPWNTWFAHVGFVTGAAYQAGLPFKVLRIPDISLQEILSTQHVTGFASN